MDVMPLTPLRTSQDHLLPPFNPLMTNFLIGIGNKSGKNIDRGEVLPVLIPLQGHPESGRLWESLINHTSKRMGFTTTTHDITICRSIYTSTGENIYLIRQVDYFELACSNESVADDIDNQIGDDIKIPCESDKNFNYFDLITYFNGIDIEQSCY